MISMDKQYRTRNGDPVRILYTNKKGNNMPVVALVTLDSNNEEIHVFTKEGKFYNNINKESSFDLIEVTPYDDFKIDEPVMVRDYPDEPWKRRYFAGVSKDGCPTTWAMGTTSWSGIKDRYSKCSWLECRRPTPEELGEKK